MKLEDSAYDLIVSLDVLEHIPDEGGALGGLHGKLALGGKLLITVPAMPWLWSAHDVAHPHQRHYTGGTLKAVLGFRLRYQSHFNSLLFPLFAAARAVGKLTKREGGDDALPSPMVNRLLQGVFGLERL